MCCKVLCSSWWEVEWPSGLRLRIHNTSVIPFQDIEYEFFNCYYLLIFFVYTFLLTVLICIFKNLILFLCFISCSRVGVGGRERNYSVSTCMYKKYMEASHRTRVTVFIIFMIIIVLIYIYRSYHSIDTTLSVSYAGSHDFQIEKQ